MKRLLTIILITAASLTIGLAAYQALPASPHLSQFMPAGGLLYLEAKDFSSLLSDWNQSAEKTRWIGSTNYEAFANSRLFLRLKAAGDQFGAAAGLPPDMSFLTQAAGKESAFVLYDIGKLQFLYITHLAPASGSQNTLWQSRSKFETRNAGGVTFYLRREAESEREVEFAVSGDYFLLATREDLMAGALQLLAGSKDRTVEDEPWFSQPVHAAGAPGDLRLVLDLDKIVPSPYFRSYWVQQNITDIKQYSSAVSDLFREGRAYREQRTLMKRTSQQDASPANEAADLLRFAPDDAGMYLAQSAPSTDYCFDVIASKLLGSHLSTSQPSQLAPLAPPAESEAGASTDLETRIDQAPSVSNNTNGSSALKTLLANNPVRGMLQVDSSAADPNTVFVRIHSGVVLLGTSEWDEAAVRRTLSDSLAPALTTSALGVTWQPANGYAQLSGLLSLAVSVRGKYLFVSDDAALLTRMLAGSSQKMDTESATYIARFEHGHERENFARLTTIVDRPLQNPAASGAPPQFFSENIVSLSAALADVTSEKITVQNMPDKVLQTVTYQWSR